MRTLAILALLVASVAGAEPPAAASELFKERSDSYAVTWKGIGLGTGTIKLLPLAANCYRYQSTTDPMALVRWTYGAPREVSEFCVESGAIIPRHFEYINDTRKKDAYSLDFDWAHRKVKSIKGSDVQLRELPGAAYDHFLIQLAVRQWVIAHADDPQPAQQDFTMVDDKRITAYRVAITGRETIDLPAGRFDTIRVERIDNPNRSSRFWVAPSRGYMPVKIEHIEKGDVQLRMELRPDGEG
jgi:hypothetical protein